MFNDIENSGLLKSVAENRLSQTTSSDIVLASLLEKYDFGQKLFQKTLNRTVLKPISLAK